MKKFFYFKIIIILILQLYIIPNSVYSLAVSTKLGEDRRGFSGKYKLKKRKRKLDVWGLGNISGKDLYKSKRRKPFGERLTCDNLRISVPVTPETGSPLSMSSESSSDSSPIRPSALSMQPMDVIPTLKLSDGLDDLREMFKSCLDWVCSSKKIELMKDLILPINFGTYLTTEKNKKGDFVKIKADINVAELLEYFGYLNNIGLIKLVSEEKKAGGIVISDFSKGIRDKNGKFINREIKFPITKDTLDFFERYKLFNGGLRSKIVLISEYILGELILKMGSSFYLKGRKKEELEFYMSLVLNNKIYMNFIKDQMYKNKFILLSVLFQNDLNKIIEVYNFLGGFLGFISVWDFNCNMKQVRAFISVFEKFNIAIVKKKKLKNQIFLNEMLTGKELKSIFTKSNIIRKVFNSFYIKIVSSA
jgi:hypothetical protein